MEKVKQFFFGYFRWMLLGYVWFSMAGTLIVLRATDSWVYHFAWPGKLTEFQIDMLFVQATSIIGAVILAYVFKRVDDSTL